MKLVPLVEAFGPTIQGEGFLAGLPTLFLRFGLCDFRCVWCDSKYAVDPEMVKRDARRVSTDELLDEVAGLSAEPIWITLSGGNPAMHDLGEFVALAQEAGYLVSVETQGSLWRGWLADVDHLTVSPKPPSSGMWDAKHARLTDLFFANASAMDRAKRSCKIVVFDQEDLDWARDFIAQLEPYEWDTFLSVGTATVSEWETEVVKAVNERQARDEIGASYRWLCEQVASDPVFRSTRVLPQLHVIAWGHAKGV